ncbi:MAG: MBL fold metallo-hydrolase [Kiritimatiellia bacterium]
MLELDVLLVTLGAVLGMAAAAATFETDLIPTNEGDLKITFIGHGTLMFEFSGKIIHVDPWSSLADYSKLPKADLILVTHDHYDHLDTKAIEALCTNTTRIMVTSRCAAQVAGGTIMRNGDVQTIAGVRIEAVPAYNIVHKRANGQPFHHKGEGNGYVLTFGDCRVYVAGDTEPVPEMEKLKGLSIAFLPMNLPYTMTPEMVAQVARMIRPKILYPYHYGETDPRRLLKLLEEEKGIDVRIRKLR